MIETVFFTVNEWMSTGSYMAAPGCFLWGVISVLFSPCHLASIPLIIAYVGGQRQLLHPRRAGYYALVFTAGLFITIALIGSICALLGRMLGDVGSYWQIPVGLILMWVSLGMFSSEKCSMIGNMLSRFHVKGISGAFILGLSYGILSGSCTFGFIAPILALITVQHNISSGMIMMVAFASGHCLPIVIAGSFTSIVRNILENGIWRGTERWFRKGAAVLIGGLGAYFIINPFLVAG